MGWIGRSGRRQAQINLATLGTRILRSALLCGLVLSGCNGSHNREAGPYETPAQSPAAAGWAHYGGDAGGQRFSTLSEIHRGNVANLEIAWTHHHGDWSDGKGAVRSTSAFENTPILVGDALIYCTPFNKVIALDAETGEERWRFDPAIDLSGRYANQLICRGVAAWRDPERAPSEACATRVFSATNDARLLALDASTGALCADFGASGIVDLNPDAGEQRWLGEYQVTSAPTQVSDLVIVGSAVGDNQRTNAPSGVVRAFDARTGALRWAWDLAPPGFERTPENTSRAGYVLGTPNVWAPMSVDVQRQLVFVPTGNPSPDYFRGESKLDYYGSSVVALRASTGEVVWHFQTVHRDLWDFDVASQPTLVDLERDGVRIPALVQATKMGLVFVLNRETGEPIFGVEERPVPQNGVAGEVLSPTQPFPLAPPPISRQRLTPDDAWGLLFFDRLACRRRFEAIRNDGPYTPPTLQGSLMFPGNAGGTNWGGVSVDPTRGLLVVNSQNLPWQVSLFPAAEFEARRAAEPHMEISPQRGTPYGMRRELLRSPLGVPCNAPPWGQIAMIDLASGEIRWEVPFGTLRDLTPIPIPGVSNLEIGTPNLGGPLSTAGGLIFIAAAFDNVLRAFDVESGALLWKGRLPAGAQATPMTYRVRDGGRQLVVIAAGGYGRGGTKLGDSLVAFALPARAE